MRTSQDFLSAAVQYAQRGWSVFPVHTPEGGGCSCNKMDCQKAGKHPRTRHGVKDATTDESTIRAWWTKWPSANIGVATGARSSLCVLDVDNKSGATGSTVLEALQAQYGDLPKTLTCTTGSGQHIYFMYPEGEVENSVGRLGAGLDMRGDNGYVIAPPSLHANGKVYSWIDSSSPLAPLPDWLHELIRNCATTEREDVDSTLPANDFIPIGSRNDRLTQLAGGLRARGLDRAGIEAELLHANVTKLEGPLSVAEVRGIAESVARYGPGEYRPSLAWFKFYPNEWFCTRVVRIGSDRQRGWYIQLLAECWRDGGFLPDDPDLIWRLAGAPSREVFERNDDHLLVLSEFEPVVLEDGAHVLAHKRMVVHYREQAARHRQTCEAAAKSAAKRKGPQEVKPDARGNESVG